ALCVEQAVQPSILWKPSDPDAPFMMFVPEPRGDTAKCFRAQDSRQAAHITERARRARLSQAERYILSLSETPLKIHQVGDAIAHGPRHDGYASRERQTERREK